MARLAFGVSLWWGAVAGAGLATAPSCLPRSEDPELVADGLANPRGIVPGSDGTLLVAEAGSGNPFEDDGRSGRISMLRDVDGDGNWLDPGERHSLMGGFASYNGRSVFGTGRDEVGGLNDLVSGPPSRLLFTTDDPQAEYVADGAQPSAALWALDLTTRQAEVLTRRPTTSTGIAWDPSDRTVYLAESGANRLVGIAADGFVRIVTTFEALADGQQAVPAGMDRDPISGELVVALFSGVLYDTPRPGDRIAFVPGASKVVAVDPRNGATRDVVLGLTTAVDVAWSPDGSLLVLEMTSGAAPPRLPDAFDLYDPAAPPVPGGYARFAGRLSARLPDGTFCTLLSGLDTPTHLAVADGFVYVATGQGTPGRPIPGPQETTRIRGQIWRIAFPPSLR